VVIRSAREPHTYYEGVTVSDSRTHPVREQPSRRAIAWARDQRRRRLQVLMVAVTVLLAVTIGVLVLSRGTTSTSSQAGITTPAALAPMGSLLPVGSTFPDFSLSTVAGKQYQLSGLRGSPVLLEYFAVWCPVCHAEAPTVNAIDQTFVPRGVHSFMILANPYGRDYESKGDQRPVNKGDITWYTDTYHITTPILIDPNFADVNVVGADHYPTFYVVDAKGIIRYARSGEIPYSELADALVAAGARG
jgi:cytochrome c biogenesis protein CcmG/thiol:disulfide interchange protein DsbE